MKQIAILGAFDRFNFGDLLFPHVIDYVINRWIDSGFPEYPKVFYGIRESDLSGYGGKKTLPIEELFSDGCLDDNSVLILAGGEILSPTWFEIYYTLMEEPQVPFMRMIRQSLKPEVINKIRPKFPNANLYQPFVISSKDFEHKIIVVYNTVGGSKIVEDSYPTYLLSSLLNKIKHSTYISVRESKLYEFLREKKLDNLALSPDVAALVSKVFPKKSIIEMVSAEVSEWVKNEKDGYIVFQIANKYANDISTLQNIANQLSTISTKYHKKIVLCPMGIGPGHFDNLPLNKLVQMIKTETYHINNPSVFDILALISNSSMFIGSSLHGHITAMSYAIPSMSTAKNLKKLENYLKTWALPGYDEIVDPNDLLGQFEKYYCVDRKNLETKSKILGNLAFNSLEEMKIKIIENLEKPTSQIKCTGNENLIYKTKRVIKRILKPFSNQ